MKSYSVRCVVRHPNIPRVSKNLYEERITLWRAESFEEALAKAEKEAHEYAAIGGDECLDLFQVFELADELDADGIEVYSLMRDSELSPDEYVDSFFDTGLERQGILGSEDGE